MDKQLLAVLGLLITNAGFLFGMWKHFDSRLSRVYERFDEHKEHVENKFVQKEHCKISHDSTANNLAGIETRISERFDKLENRVENSFHMILDIIKKA